MLIGCSASINKDNCGRGVVVARTAGATGQATTIPTDSA